MNEELTAEEIEGLARSLLNGNRPRLGALAPGDVDSIMRRMAVIRREKVEAKWDAEEAKEAARKKARISSATAPAAGKMRPARTSKEGSEMVMKLMRSEDFMAAFVLLQAAGQAFKVGMAAAAAAIAESTTDKRPP